MPEARMAVRVAEIAVTAAVMAGACVGCSDEGSVPRQRMPEGVPERATKLHIVLEHPDEWADVEAVVASHVDEGTDALRECEGMLLQIYTLPSAGAAIDTTLEGSPFDSAVCLDILVTSGGIPKARVIWVGAAFSYAHLDTGIDTVWIAIH